MGGLVFGNGSRRGRCGMKAETLQKVRSTIDAYNEGELEPEQAFLSVILPVMMETMQEGLKPDRKPLEVSEGTIDTILQRRAAGNISEVQVLALVILDQLQAQEHAAAS